jgi:hypothetical protein
MFNCNRYCIFHSIVMVGTHHCSLLLRLMHVLCVYQCIFLCRSRTCAMSGHKHSYMLFNCFGQSNADDWVHQVGWCAERWSRPICCLALCRADCLIMDGQHFQVKDWVSCLLRIPLPYLPSPVLHSPMPWLLTQGSKFFSTLRRIHGLSSPYEALRIFVLWVGCLLICLLLLPVW